MKAYAYELVVAEASAAGVGRGATASKRAVATAVRMARPSDPPICWLALSRADATPVSSWGTPATAEDVTLTKAPPIPVPMSTSDGSRSR